MLRNLIASYIDQVSERDLDYPLLALLSAMGYYDVHYTHGSVEFGKDFIAKKLDDGVIYQYSFQSKVGNISLGEWRAGIKGQMLEAVTTGISHPQFDRSLPHQSILITTGRLAGNVGPDLQDLNNGLLKGLQLRPIKVWDRENVITNFAEYGLDALIQVDTIELSDYTNFLISYAKALQGSFSEREVEGYTGKWLRDNSYPRRQLLDIAVESEMLVQQLLKHGMIYESFQIYLGSIRAIGYLIQDKRNVGRRNELIETYRQAVDKVRRTCLDFLKEFDKTCRSTDGGLLRISHEGMMSYIVLCARIMELASISYFLGDEKERTSTLRFLKDFIDHEQGCGHIPSDRYTVTLVITVLALCNGDKKEAAVSLIRRAAVWLFDRYDQGIGLATFEADEYTETATLLGYAFDLPDINPPSGSFLATAIADLSNFVGDSELYETIINDIKALGIAPNFWQVPDSAGIFSVEAEDVISYPNIEYNGKFTDFGDFDFAEHIRAESQQYEISKLLDYDIFLFLMLHLRDRYFPTMWPYLTDQQVSQPSST